MSNDKILEYIKENGGITLTEKGKKAELKKGFMVSLFGTEYKTENKKEMIDKVKEYLEKIKDNRNGLFVGVWLEEGLYYVDFSVCIIDRVEALEFGKKHKQKSIYNINEDSYIYINDYNFRKYYIIYEIIRDNINNNNNNNIIDYRNNAQFKKLKELYNYFLNIPKQTIKNSIYLDLQDNYAQCKANNYFKKIQNQDHN